MKSGTSTLEAAILGCPQVVVYRVSWTTYRIMKVLLTGVKWIGLVNIVPGKSVAKELIQYGLTPETVADELVSLLSDPARRAAMLADYAKTRRLLGGEGATHRAAGLVADLLP